MSEGNESSEFPRVGRGVVWVLYSMWGGERFVPGDPCGLQWLSHPCCFPAVSWQKDGSVLRSDGHLLIRAEGERHTLLLREARAADAGSYTATATNELGQASCAATLAVRPGRERGPWGRLGRAVTLPCGPKLPFYSQPRARLSTCMHSLFSCVCCSGGNILNGLGHRAKAKFSRHTPVANS